MNTFNGINCTYNTTQLPIQNNNMWMYLGLMQGEDCSANFDYCVPKYCTNYYSTTLIAYNQE